VTRRGARMLPPPPAARHVGHSAVRVVSKSLGAVDAAPSAAGLWQRGRHLLTVLTPTSGADPFLPPCGTTLTPPYSAVAVPREPLLHSTARPGHPVTAGDVRADERQCHGSASLAVVSCLLNAATGRDWGTAQRRDLRLDRAGPASMPAAGHTAGEAGDTAPGRGVPHWGRDRSAWRVCRPHSSLSLAAGVASAGRSLFSQPGGGVSASEPSATDQDALCDTLRPPSDPGLCPANRRGGRSRVLRRVGSGICPAVRGHAGERGAGRRRRGEPAAQRGTGRAGPDASAALPQAGLRRAGAMTQGRAATTSRPSGAIQDTVRSLYWLRAPFHPVIDPPRGEKFGGRGLLGHPPDLEVKAEGDNSMVGKREQPEDADGGVPQDPRDMVKAALPEPQSPAVQIHACVGWFARPRQYHRHTAA
jgi:hypothetical protein